MPASGAGDRDGGQRALVDTGADRGETAARPLCPHGSADRFQRVGGQEDRRAGGRRIGLRQCRHCAWNMAPPKCPCSPGVMRSRRSIRSAGWSSPVSCTISPIWTMRSDGRRWSRCIPSTSRRPRHAGTGAPLDNFRLHLASPWIDAGVEGDKVWANTRQPARVRLRACLHRHRGRSGAAAGTCGVQPAHSALARPLHAASRNWSTRS